LVMLC